MIPKAMQPLDRVLECFDQALASSPADFTELVWIEQRQRRAGSREVGGEPQASPTVRERCALVRVIEGGRSGHFRNDSLDVHELADGIRQALAQARVASPAQPRDADPTQTAAPSAVPKEALFDTRLARLRSRDGLERVADLAGSEAAVDFAWSEGRVLVVNSGGQRSQARVTCAQLTARSGRGAGAGMARAAGRTLEDLDGLGLVELSRLRTVTDNAAEEPLAGAPVVLAPEASAALTAELGTHLWRHRCLPGDGPPPALSPFLDLYDDASDPAGLPFPFDLQGRVHGRVPLITAGRVATGPLPSLSTGADEEFPTHLFLAPGTASEAELLAAADGGVWIGALDGVECRGGSLVIRAQARQRRRITGGRLAAPLPDTPWEEGLDTVLGSTLMLAKGRLRQPLGDGVFGGFTAPALAYRVGRG